MVRLSEDLRKRLLQLRGELVDKHEQCSGRGYVINEEGNDIRCTCMRTFVYLKALCLAGIPQSYWQLHYSELVVDDVYKRMLQHYFDRFNAALRQGLGFLFLGTNGVGKTAMMCEIGKQAIIRQVSTQYLTVQRYIGFTQAAMLSAGNDARRRLDEIEAARVLLVDEIDKAYMKEGSSFVTRTTEEFLRRSLSAGKLLVLASNEDEAALTELFGESVLSMLKRHLKFVHVRGSDFSDTKQSSWKKALDEDFDYWHKNICDVAVLFNRAQEEIVL